MPKRLPLAALLVAVLGAAPSPAPQATMDAALCRRFYHGACSDAMGRWLPRALNVDYQWLDQHARHINRLDHFVYEKQRQRSSGPLAGEGPEDGTFFVYGNAGPPKGHAIYDYAHHIAFYEEGCCAWHDVVAAADAPAPPKGIVARDLRNLRTLRGIRLGMTHAEVMHIYGRTIQRPAKGRARSTLLAYTTPIEFRSGGYSNTCGQWQNFVFRADRLVWIQLSNAC